jgi:hypothetical protein
MLSLQKIVQQEPELLQKADKRRYYSFLTLFLSSSFTFKESLPKTFVLFVANQFDQASLLFPLPLLP